MTTGERILKYRKEAGLSQEELSERVGVSRQAVSKWELDAALPETEKLLALARVFGVSVDELLGNAPEPEDAPSPPPPDGGSYGRHDLFGWVMRLIERKGYVAGYLLMAWGALIILMVVGVSVAWSHMLSDPFGGMPDMGFPDMELPSAFRAVFIVPAVGGVIGLALFVTGVVVVVKYKPKRK